MNKKNNWQDLLSQQNFTWAVFEFDLIAEQNIFLPKYKGSVLRGGFGNVFRNVCCTMKRTDCLDCMFSQQCAYAYIFETPGHEQIQIGKFADNFPHPFVIEPPSGEQTIYSPGDRFSFSLVLFGKSIQYLPYFVFSFFQLGKQGLGKGRGRFILDMVKAIDIFDGRNKEIIYDNVSQKLQGNYRTWTFQDLYSANIQKKQSQLKIEFVTPTRILVKKKLIETLTFDLLIRILLRRISWMGKIHCEADWELPFQEIIKAAGADVKISKNNTHWIDWERYSSRQKRSMKLGGFAGSVEFRGNISPFISLILLGQYTHIGKNTTFGLGKYIVGDKF